MRCVRPLVAAFFLFASSAHSQSTKPRPRLYGGIIPCETVAVSGTLSDWVLAHRREFFDATCLTAEESMDGKPFAAYLVVTQPKLTTKHISLIGRNTCEGEETVGGYKVDCDEGNGEMIESESYPDDSITVEEVPSTMAVTIGKKYVEMTFYSLHQARVLWKGYGSNSTFRWFGLNLTKRQRERFSWPHWLGTLAYATQCPKKGEYCDPKKLPARSFQ